MASNESGFSREIRKSLEEVCGTKCYARKIVMGVMMNTGISDLIGCLNGRFFGIESKFIDKLPKRGESKIGKEFTDDQLTNARQIEEAGGVAIGLVCINELKTAIIIPYEELAAFNEITLDGLRSIQSETFNNTLAREHGRWNVTRLVKYIGEYKRG